MKNRKVIVLVVVSLLGGIMAIVFFLKPVRIIWPYFAGVVCIDKNICIENLSNRETAKQLYTNALSLVERKLSPLQQAPRVVFCHSKHCSHWFGLKREAAFSVGTFGIIISHRGWKEFYVAHEFIHHWQAEQVGNIKLLLLPAWLAEGMAYSLSDDPRRPLPDALENYRREFEKWCKLECRSDLPGAFVQASGN